MCANANNIKYWKYQNDIIENQQEKTTTNKMRTVDREPYKKESMCRNRKFILKA